VVPRRYAGFQIVPELSARGDAAGFGKLALPAFAGTPPEMAPRDLGIRAAAIAGAAWETGTGPAVWHAVDPGFIPVAVTDACGGRDRPALQRVPVDIRFAADTLLTGIAAITPLLPSPPAR
jgi:nicotinamidase-related amidase